MEHLQNLIDALSNGSLYALFALGIALIFGIMKLINFAHGELIMAAGYTLFLLYGHVPTVVMIALAAVIPVAFALAMDRVVYKRLPADNQTTMLVASFAVSFLLQSSAILIFGSVTKTVNVSTWLSSTFQVGGLTVSVLSVVAIGVTLSVLALLGLFLTRADLGIQMRAAADDFRMARILGIRANLVVGTSFIISGLLAGIAGVFLVAQTGTVYPLMGVSPLLIAFIATVIGGLGSLKGAIIGGYVFGFISVALQAYLPGGLSVYRDAFAYGVVIALLLLRPEGIIAPKAAIARI